MLFRSEPRESRSPELGQVESSVSVHVHEDDTGEAPEEEYRVVTVLVQRAEEDVKRLTSPFKCETVVEVLVMPDQHCDRCDTTRRVDRVESPRHDGRRQVV